MRFLECLQGSQEWLDARAGLTTASKFFDAVSTIGGLTEQQQKYVDAILAEGLEPSAAAAAAGYKAAPTADIIKRALRGESTVSPSDTALRYAADVAIEQINGGPFAEPPRAWLLDRGHELEAMARMHYEARTQSLVTESGLCIDDDGVFAYSSDGLVDDDGLIEIKAPIDGAKIIAMWRNPDLTEYMHQMQGGMWLTGRKWVDFIMYAPMLASVGKDLFIKRVLRDDEFIDKMAVELARFQRLVKDNYYFLKAKI